MHHAKEVSGSYTDDDDRYSIENCFHADDRSIGTEVFFGKSIRQDNRQLRLPGCVVTLAKKSTGRGRNAENGKKVIGYELKPGLLREAVGDLKNCITDARSARSRIPPSVAQTLVRGIGKKPLCVERGFYCME